MPPIIPNRFLVRLAHPCPYVKDVPDDSDDAGHLVELPESARLHNFAELDGLTNFADVRLARDLPSGDHNGSENPMRSSPIARSYCPDGS